MLRNYQARNAIRYGGRCFLMFLIGCFAGITNMDWLYTKSNVRAAAWNLAHFPLRERTRIQNRRRVSDRRLYGHSGSEKLRRSRNEP
jgi:hypothetical protein